MSEEYKKLLMDVLDGCVYEIEPYKNKNDVLLLLTKYAIAKRSAKNMIELAYEICKRHGIDKNEFIERIEKERCRQEELHPYNENYNYELIAIEEYG